jgi:hypothetical protein
LPASESISDNHAFCCAHSVSFALLEAPQMNAWVFLLTKNGTAQHKTVSASGRKEPLPPEHLPNDKRSYRTRFSASDHTSRRVT